MRQEFRKRRQRSCGHDINGLHGIFHEIQYPHGVNDGRCAGDPHGFPKKCSLLAVALDQMHVRAIGVSANAQAITKPGNPAPEPKSAQTEPSAPTPGVAANSATCRVHRIGIGRARNQIDPLLPIEQRLDKAIEPRRCFT